ncbi:hypothetical protein AWC38_SpisGene15207 [Stylophora pistillata]|uniref:Uncharacterized protein n=1 Tax=Stylophora pistillata TaxID=50429 RepID=A0A2B4RVI1_STYPI|nr:hypothetical protein AWC38_SpisGene15207 [Stylophora pistillata]
MTSQGREVLSMCHRLLDLIADPSNPIKREVLKDMCDLTRTNGSAIATAIRNSLQKHAIDIRNCRGQAYDTTASKSSDKKGVQAELAKNAPDAEYQELKSRFSKEKRAHYELCAPILQVIASMSEEATVELAQVLHEKWGHLMSLPSSFESELFRWMNQWKRQEASDYESISVSSPLAKHADNIFFPNVRELLKILAVLPMHGGGKVIFSYSEDPYLASQHNDHCCDHPGTAWRWLCPVWLFREKRPVLKVIFVVAICFQILLKQKPLEVIVERTVVTLKENKRTSDLEGGTLYAIVLEKIPQSLLSQYYRWVKEKGKLESFEELREWVAEEAEYQIQASEVKNGVSSASGKNVKWPRLYFGTGDKCDRPCKEVRGGDGEPSARLCPLGWTAIGAIDVCEQHESCSTGFFHTHLMQKSYGDDGELNNLMKQFWNLEAIGITPRVDRQLTPGERLGVNKVNESMRFIGERYESTLAPLKAVSIPRLELLGALIGTRLTMQICSALKISIDEVTYWVDSKNVGYWIQGQSREYKPFIAHRVGEIHECSAPSQWRYVATNANPAVYGTRGLTVKDSASTEDFDPECIVLSQGILKYGVSSMFASGTKVAMCTKSPGGTKADLVLKVYALLMREILPSAANSDDTGSSGPSNEEFTYDSTMRRILALGWSTDLRNLPEMNFIQLYDYVVVSTRKYRHIVLKENFKRSFSTTVLLSWQQMMPDEPP